MSFNTNQKLLVFADEVTAGTRVDPTYPTDNNIRLFDVGEASLDIPKEPIGQLADGTFAEGPAYSRERRISIPDFKTEVVWSGLVTTEPKWFRLAQAAGYKVELNGSNPELIWDGSTDCDALSGDLTMYTCGSTPAALREKFRGAVGNLSIGSDGPQAPIIASMTGMMGAYLGQFDVSGAAIPAYGTLDTASVEQMGKYTATIGGVTYAVQAWEFNPNNEINGEGANNDEGIARMKITNQGARLTMTVTRLDVASDDPITDMFDNSTIATIAITGGSGAHFTFTFTNSEYVEVQPSDSNGTASYDLTLKPTSLTVAQQA